MEETRKKLAEMIQEQVRRENEEASLAVERFAAHKGWVDEEESSKLELSQEEVETLVQPNEDECLDLLKKEEAEDELQGFERGLYAVAGAIIFLALIYLGTYIHEQCSNNVWKTLERTPEIFYHYESEPVPYHYQGALSDNVPYSLEEYIIREMMGL